MKTETLPAGWKLVKFGEVVRNVNENSRDFEADGIDRIVGLDHLDSESLPLRRWDELSDLPDGTSFSRMFRAGQVLFGKRRAYQRKVAVADFDGICSGDILVFEPASDKILLEFLPYVVQSEGFFAQALGTSAGSLSPRTKWSDLAKYEFALPPIDEQRRISVAIGAAETLRVAAQSALSRAEVELCHLAARLTFEVGDSQVSLESVADVLNSLRIPVNDAERAHRKGDVPYYGANGRVGKIDDFIFDEPLTLIPEDGGRFDEWRVQSVAYRIEGPSWVNNHAHVLRATGIPHGWLYFSLRNMDYRHLIVGSTRTKLNRSALGRIQISIPADLDRRLQILESAESLMVSAQIHLETVENLCASFRESLIKGGGDRVVQ
jgi:restriction endonuclease S subunit